MTKTCLTCWWPMWRRSLTSTQDRQNPRKFHVYKGLVTNITLPIRLKTSLRCWWLFSVDNVITTDFLLILEELETDFHHQKKLMLNFIYKVQNQLKAVVMSHPWCVLIIHHLSMIKQKSSSFSLCKILSLVYVGVYRYWKVKRERVVSWAI